MSNDDIDEVFESLIEETEEEVSDANADAVFSEFIEEDDKLKETVNDEFSVLLDEDEKIKQEQEAEAAKVRAAQEAELAKLKEAKKAQEAELARIKEAKEAAAAKLKEAAEADLKKATDAEFSEFIEEDTKLKKATDDAFSAALKEEEKIAKQTDLEFLNMVNEEKQTNSAFDNLMEFDGLTTPEIAARSLSKVAEDTQKQSQLTEQQITEKNIANLQTQINNLSASLSRGIASSGGGGSTRLMDNDDVVFSRPSDNHILQYDGSINKFVSRHASDLLETDSIGGYEFTGGFTDRVSGQAGASDIGNDVEYTSAMVSAGTWLRFGFDSTRQIANDLPYWGDGADPDEAPHSGTTDYQGVGVFSGAYMPSGVTSLFNFTDNTTYNAAQESGSLQYTAATGSYDMSQLKVGDFCQFRFDFNLTAQFPNTTIELGLIWATRNASDDVTFTFALTGQPLFLGDVAGETFLNRPIITAYLASAEDVNARALPAIRADQPVFVQPLTSLFVVGR